MTTAARWVRGHHSAPGALAIGDRGSATNRPIVSSAAVTLLEGTQINQIAEAADGTLWAVGTHDGEGGGLYRISLE